jgi:hypothetical protein
MSHTEKRNLQEYTVKESLDVFELSQTWRSLKAFFPFPLFYPCSCLYYIYNFTTRGKRKVPVKKELNTITPISVYYTQLNTSLCMCWYCYVVGQDSSVDIANRYGLDGPRIEVRQGRDFPHQSRTALGSTQSGVQWVPGLFPRGKAARAWHLPPNTI